jgi:hypothetical protein
VESNHVIPRYQRGAVTVWLTPFVLSMSGLGSVRTSPCRVSTGRSAIRASRPLAVVQVEPAAGIEPAPSRLRGERPCHSGPRRHGVHHDGVAGGIRTLIPGVACRDPRRWTTTTGGEALVRCDGRPGGTLTRMTLVRACRSRAPRSSATGRWLPGRGSNPHLPGNGRTSCRSTTWHGRATDGCCGN